MLHQTACTFHFELRISLLSQNSWTRLDDVIVLLFIDPKTVVYSEGTLNLDNCDFSESSSSVLVLGQQEFTTVRNAILGDVNCKSVVCIRVM